LSSCSSGGQADRSAQPSLDDVLTGEDRAPIVGAQVGAQKGLAASVIKIKDFGGNRFDYQGWPPPNLRGVVVMSGIEVERRRDRVIEFIRVKSVVLGEIGRRIVPDKFIILAAVCLYSRHRYRADVPVFRVRLLVCKDRRRQGRQRCDDCRPFHALGSFHSIALSARASMASGIVKSTAAAVLSSMLLLVVCYAVI
jgi:hypothetical protein